MRLVLSLIMLSFLGLAYAYHDRYVFKSEQQEQQFNQLTQELRCLVCQNESLEASNAPLANDIKSKIYTMVLAGKNNEEILAYLTARYGDFIDFRPPITPRTYVLWFGPFALLALGFLIFYRLCRKNRTS